MKLFSRMNRKNIFAGVLVALAVAFPAASLAADTVQIEGALGVANVTAGDTKYVSSVNASYDQVVKYEVYYHNRELPDSGKVANNLRVKIALPNAAGKTQTATATISSDNSNTVTDSATVNLDRADASIQYIPGSAIWKHNTGTNDAPTYVETKVSDDIVTSGQGIVLENEKPCFNYSATVTVLARVTVPGVKIVKEVEKANETNNWKNTNTANPGDTLKYRITYQNTGNTTQNQVVIRDNLPPKMTLVPGTTYLYDASHLNGVLIGTDNVTQGGVNAGDFGPGAIAYVTFQVKVPAADQLACGNTDFTNVGVVHPQGMNEFYNTAITTVNRVCQTAQTPTCDSLQVTKGDNRTVTVSAFNTTANGASLNRVIVDWGDNTTPLTTNTVVGQSHKYAADGTYTISAVAHFTVNGADVTAGGATCSQKVTFTTPGTPVPPTPAAPTKLVNTGPGSTLAMFLGVTAFGAFAHRFFLARRLAS